jgi:hypothetical protein
MPAYARIGATAGDPENAAICSCVGPVSVKLRPSKPRCQDAHRLPGLALPVPAEQRHQPDDAEDLPTLPGAWVALAFVCLSFTPSLLPRPAFFEGFVCGVDGAIGYGMGVIGAWLWRQFADRPARPARRRPL